MRRRPWLATLLSACALAALWSGCGSDSPTAGRDGSEATDSAPATATTSSFRFVVWSDTAIGTYEDSASRLASLSRQASAVGPFAFTLYPGDTQDVGFDLSLAAAFRDALDGHAGNGTFARTFAVRGNHDALLSSSVASWQAFFDVGAVAAAAGATNLSQSVPDLSYSFDYGNAHFVALDVPGNITAMTAAQRSWLDADLASAAARGLQHAFLFWHGPLWSLTGYHPISPTASAVQALVQVLNKHPMVSAIFVGHEHLTAWTHLTSARIPNLAIPIEQLHHGATGALWYPSISGRADASLEMTDAFGVVEVSDGAFTVTWYRSGTASPYWSRTFTKALVAVSDVAVQPSSAAIAAGASLQLTAEVSPANATNQSVEWSVPEAWCGSVTSAGLYTAPPSVPAPATCTVRATAQDGSGTTGEATLTITSPGAMSLDALAHPTASTFPGAKIVGFGVALGSGNTSALTTTPFSTSTADLIVVAASVTGYGNVSPPSITSSAPLAFTRRAYQPSGSWVPGYAASVIWTAPVLAPLSNATITVATAVRGVPMVDALVTVYAVSGAGAVGSVATKDLNTGAATTVDATFSAATGNAPQSSDSWLFFAGLTGGLAKPLSPRANTAWDAVAYSQVPDSLANGRCLSHSTEDTTIGALGTATYVVAAAMELRSSGNAPAVVPVEGVTLAPGTASLQPGQTQQFMVTVSPSNATNPAVEWSVPGSGCGSVASDGLYTAPALAPTPATCTVRATALDGSGISGQATLTITSPEAMALDPAVHPTAGTFPGARIVNFAVTLGSGTTRALTTTPFSTSSADMIVVVASVTGYGNVSPPSITSNAPLAFTRRAYQPSGSWVPGYAASAIWTAPVLAPLPSATVTVATAGGGAPMVDALVTVYAVTGAGAVGSIATKDLNTGAATWVDATFSAKGGNAPQSSDSWLFFGGLTGGLARPLSPRPNTVFDAVAYSQVPDSLANGRCLSHSTADTTVGALDTATFVVAAGMELRPAGAVP